MHVRSAENHARGNKYISNSRRFFDVYVFVLNSNSSPKIIFTYVHCSSYKRNFSERGQI